MAAPAARRGPPTHGRSSCRQLLPAATLLLLALLLLLTGAHQAQAASPRKLLQVSSPAESAAGAASATTGTTQAAGSSTTQGGGQASSPQAPSAAAMLNSTARFFLDHGIDREYGGFLASLDRQGNAIPPTNKTAIQQASQLTAFSHLLSALQDPRRALPPSTLNATELRAAADTAYNFLTTKMIAQVQPNGTLFIYEVPRQGLTLPASSNGSSSSATNGSTPLNSGSEFGLSVGANAAVVQGLAAYARATNDTRALQLALSTFQTLDRLFGARGTGGYDESNATLTFGNPPLPEAPAGPPPGSDAEGAAGEGGPPLDEGEDAIIVVGGPVVEPTAAAGGPQAGGISGGSGGGSSGATQQQPSPSPSPSGPQQQQQQATPASPSPAGAAGNAVSSPAAATTTSAPPAPQAAPAVTSTGSNLTAAGSNALAPGATPAGGNTAARRLLQAQASDSTSSSTPATMTAPDSGNGTVSPQTPGPLAQSFETLLATTAALTELSRALDAANSSTNATGAASGTTAGAATSGDASALVRTRLRELTELLGQQTLLATSAGNDTTAGSNTNTTGGGAAGGRTPEVFVQAFYDPRSWWPVGNSTISYGTNLEAAWLLADAVAELERHSNASSSGASSDEGPSGLSGLKRAFTDLAAANIDAAYDNSTGDVFYSTELDAPGPNSTQTHKVAWTQFAALNSLLLLADTSSGPQAAGQQPGNAAAPPDYPALIHGTLALLGRNLYDPQFGSFYDQVPAAGGAPLPFQSAGVPFNATDKGTVWLTALEPTRALLRLVQAGY